MNDDDNDAIIKTKKSCVYTKCYCEENVWKLCEDIKIHHPEYLNDFHVVFISNRNKTVPLWMQQAAQHNEMIIWDYHVILVRGASDKCSPLVYDLDTTLAFPCSFQEYVTRTFRTEKEMRVKFQRFFRVVPASVYLDKFASDRSHMYADGKWSATPPSYPPIQTPEDTNNIEAFWSMDPSLQGGVGVVVGLDEFYNHFLFSE